MLFFYSDMPVAPDLHYNTTLNSTGMVAIVMADNLCPVMPMHYNGRLSCHDNSSLNDVVYYQNVMFITFCL